MLYLLILWSITKSYDTTVAPDGNVTIEGFGPIQVSGLTVKQANG